MTADHTPARDAVFALPLRVGDCVNGLGAVAIYDANDEVVGQVAAQFAEAIVAAVNAHQRPSPLRADPRVTSSMIVDEGSRPYTAVSDGGEVIARFVHPTEHAKDAARFVEARGRRPEPFYALEALCKASQRCAVLEIYARVRKDADWREVETTAHSLLDYISEGIAALVTPPAPTPDAARVIEVMRKIEWAGAPITRGFNKDFRMVPTCPDCKFASEEGHATACELHAALTAAPEGKGTPPCVKPHCHHWVLTDTGTEWCKHCEIERAALLQSPRGKVE